VEYSIIEYYYSMIEYSMQTYKRPLYHTIQTLLNGKAPLIQVIIGPRQVGKSTIASQIAASFKGAIHFESADSSPPYHNTWIDAQWNTARLKAKDAPGLLILDEIQKIPGWSESVKKLWDEDRREARDIKVIILGSSALLLQEGLTESLAGRFYLHRCGHWSFIECKEAFKYTLDQWIYFGGYPGGASFLKDEDLWKNYIRDSLIETTISRDVLQMHKVNKPALLRNLFFLSARFPAQIVAYNKMVGQLQDAGNTTTIAHYLDLLETAFLVSGLESTVTLKRSSSPKIILWNNGLISALHRYSFQEALADRAWWGRLVENAVGAHLLNSLPTSIYELNYWREKDIEIDFCLSVGTARYGIEVKSGRIGKVSGIERFAKRYSKSTNIMVGAGGIELAQFFSSDPSNMFK
jgi:uncharacterized protein